MGTLRLCLALLVATAHLAAIVPNIPSALSSQAILAVRAFFVLSGFYMALVLKERYALPLTFYASRLLKLLPIYWLVCALTFAADATFGNLPIIHPVSAWQHLDLATLPASAITYVATTVVTLIGADTWVWLGFDHATGAWSHAPAYAPNVTSALVLTGVPQAWTLGLELWFYLLAPFLVRLRTRWLLVLIAFSIALRLYFQPVPTFDRALLPLELPFFLAGILLFRWRLSLSLMTARFGWLDAELGALSYPAYISHFLVFAVVNQAMRLSDSPWGFALSVSLASLIAFSVVLDRAVARPIDQLRIRLGARPFRSMTPPANQR